MVMAMQSEELRVFLAVARAGSIVAAARQLNTVQSNVTARLRKLEEGLGQPLFERHARGVTPTAAGLRLVPYAEEVAALLLAARRSVADDAEPVGSLKIGAMETTTATRLGEALAGFAARWPAVDLVLETGTTEELVAAVRAQRLEAAFVCAPVPGARLAVRPAFVEEMCLIGPPGIDRLEALAGLAHPRGFVLRRGCSYRRMLEAMLARAGIAAPRLQEYGTLEAIVASVAAGLGVSYLPRSLLAGRIDWSRVSLLPLGAAEARVETVLVTPARSHASAGLRRFLELIDEAPPGGDQRCDR